MFACVWFVFVCLGVCLLSFDSVRVCVSLFVLVFFGVCVCL